MQMPAHSLPTLMPDVLAEALSQPGLGWIALAAFVASTVRGFSGFGTAMVYLPIAGLFLDPIAAIATLLVMDSIGPLPAMPRAIKEADWPDLKRLMLGVVIALPIGLLVLKSVSVDAFRMAVSVVALMVLIALMLGLRYSGRLTRNQTLAVGGASGFLGGAVGIPGPPVILFYMASSHRASVIRATIMLQLFAFDLSFLVLTAAQGLITWPMVGIGVLLIPVVALGTILGTSLFRPEFEGHYRKAAYIIIAISALRGLPIWG